MAILIKSSAQANDAVLAAKRAIYTHKNNLSPQPWTQTYAYRYARGLFPSLLS